MTPTFSTCARLIEGSLTTTSPGRNMEEEFLACYDQCRSCSMLSIERMYAIWQAVEYLTRRRIKGAFVECGVWRGGSSMLMMKALCNHGDLTRPIRLFDTFTGMDAPTEVDVDWKGFAPAREWNDNKAKLEKKWPSPSLKEVQGNLSRTAYPMSNVELIKGRVEETIPRLAPEEIALLHLDTDWHDSTWHELLHLYPRLRTGGVILIDDYGHWRGCRAAVDRYFLEVAEPILLSRLDYTGRVGVKV